MGCGEGSVAPAHEQLWKLGFPSSCKFQIGQHAGSASCLQWYDGDDDDDDDDGDEGDNGSDGHVVPTIKHGNLKSKQSMRRVNTLLSRKVLAALTNIICINVFS